MRRYLPLGLVVSACLTPGVVSDVADGGGEQPFSDAGSSSWQARWPVSSTQPAKTWVRVAQHRPTNVWEHGAAYEPNVHALIDFGGHVLGGYPQSSYTFRFDTQTFTDTLSTAPARPQRSCLDDVVFVSSINRVLATTQSVEHGSMPQGGLSADGKRIERDYQHGSVGPWLYDARADAWEDARISGQAFGSRFHSQLVYEPGSDSVAFMLATTLTLYHPRTNAVTSVALPPELVGRRSAGAAEDPNRRALYFYGGSSQTPNPFWTGATDVAAAYDAQVLNDLWQFDMVTQTWAQVHSERVPPRGAPTYDFMRLPLVYHPPSDSLLLLVTPIDHFVAPASWPTAQLWQFDLKRRDWALIDLANAPAFPGLLRFAFEEGLLVMLGGGNEGATGRPSLSQEASVVSLGDDLNREPRPPPAPLLRQAPDGQVSLEFAANVRFDVFRSTLRPEPSAEEQLNDEPVTSGHFVDVTAKPLEVYAYRLAGAGLRSQVRSLPAFNQPARPTQVLASVVDAHHVHLSWALLDAQPVDHFIVSRNELRIGEAQTASFDDTTVDLSTGLIATYTVQAVSAGGLVSGKSPRAYSAPEAPRSFRAFKSGDTVTLKWADEGGVNVYFNDTHLNTLGVPAADLDAWMSSWQRVNPSPITGGVFEFTVPLASRSKPHTYFFARAVNALNQEGFITDLLSPTDSRFVAATPDDPRWPHL